MKALPCMALTLQYPLQYLDLALELTALLTSLYTSDKHRGHEMSNVCTL